MWWPGLPTTFRRDFPPDMTLWHIRGSKGKGCAEDLGGGGVFGGGRAEEKVEIYRWKLKER